MHRLPFRLLAIFLLAASGGCRDDIAAPTHGFLEIVTGGVAGVQVFIDDAAAGTGPGTLEPLPAGTYTVRIEKEFYDITPASRRVTVARADTVQATFELELVVAGAIEVTAVDEILGDEITGAEIFLEDTPGVYVPTGVTTPGRLDRIAPGPVRIQVRAAGHEDSAPVEATVVEFETAEIEAELGPLRAVLAEMFTYVVCPNCPAAADELEELHDAFPGRLSVIEWHTWSGLPLFDPRWKEREDFYTGGSIVGWPAVVFQGGHLEAPEERLIVGSQASDLELYRVRIENYLAQCGNDCPLALVVTGAIDASSAEITARIKRRLGALPTSLALRFVLTEGDVDAPGNDSPYHFVAREIREEAFSPPPEGEIREVAASLPVAPGWDVTHMECVVYVQSEVTGEILAVGHLP